MSSKSFTFSFSEQALYDPQYNKYTYDHITKQYNEY